MLNRLLLFLLLLIVCSFSLPKVFAQEVRSFYKGSRALGMGGAQIAVVNDETALLTNAASLGKLRNYFGTIVDPEIEWNQNGYQSYNSPLSVDPTNISSVASSVIGKPNSYYHFKRQAFPSFVMKNFGLGLYYREVLDMIMPDPGISKLNTFYQKDLVFAFGFNLPFYEGRVKIGVTGRAIDRIEIVNSALNYPGNYDLSAIASEGAAVGGDVGLILSAPWHWLPTLSVVARDVGDTRLSWKGLQMAQTASVPATVVQDYDAAIAIFPIHSDGVRSSFTLEMQNILAAQKALEVTRYYHAGWELNLKDSVFVRAGMNGRWWTAGLEVSNEYIQFQLASYGEDIGLGVNSTEDRRYVAKFCFRF